MLRESIKLTMWLALRAAAQATTVLILARTLGAHDYGRYVTALSIATSFAPILLGGPAFLYIEAKAGIESRRRLAGLWTQLLLITGAISCLAVPLLLGIVANDWQQSMLWVLVGFTEIVFIGMTEIAARHYQAQQQPSQMGFWQCAPHLARLALILAVVIVSDSITLTKWVVASSCTTWMVGLLAIRKVPRERTYHVEFGQILSFLRSSAHYGSGGVANRLIADGDKPLVTRLENSAITGSLSLAQRVLDLASLPLNSLVSTSLPKMMTAKTTAETSKIWRSLLVWPIAYALGAGLVVMYLAKPTVDLFGPDYESMSGALQGMAWLPLLSYLRGTLGNKAVAMGRGDAYAYGHWIGAIVRIAATLLIVAWIGWAGAVVSLLLAEVLSILYLAWKTGTYRVT